jgi:hypothetical protein
MLLPVMAFAAGAGAQRPPLQTTPFERVWQRADLPVSAGRAERSWTWGPRPLETRFETLVEGKNGMRQVEYYDKSRMEINNPDSDPNSQWYVSNGLLVVEMFSGKLQLGANTFEQREPARIPIAGDTISMEPGKPRVTAPTYAALVGIASLEPGQNSAQPRIGQEVHEVLGPDGRSAGDLPSSHQGVPKIKYYEPMTRHNIPDVFYDFMNASGTVFENGSYVQGPVINWIYTVGYPITEPYWITIEIRGQEYQVMIQAFQRRLLTYNPANPAPWRVEMGNVGLQYYEWRYGRAPQSTPTPAPGGIPMSSRRVITGSPADVRQYSGIDSELYTIVTDAGAWADLWKCHSSNVDPPPALPAVDFSREFVVGAWWGDKPDGCYRLDISSVTLLGDDIRVLVNSRQVDGACIQVITQPHDIHAVSKVGLTGKKYRLMFVDSAGKILGEQGVTLP